VKFAVQTPEQTQTGDGQPALLALLKQIFPYPHGNPNGMCAPTASTLALMFLNGTTPRPIVTQSGEDLIGGGPHVKDGDATEFAHDLTHRATVVLAWLQNNQEASPGSVFWAAGGGHYWLFVKDSQSQVYVIDGTHRICKKLLRTTDAQVQYQSNDQGEFTCVDFNYLDPCKLNNPSQKKDLSISRCEGALHQRWQALDQLVLQPRGG
jgi:hypothetical protein